MRNNQIMPNFLVVGAPKSGTTSLYEYLKQHNQIYMPEKKEPHFFVLGGKNIEDFHPTYANFFSYSVTSFSDYQNLFSNVTDEIAIGEASVKYLYHESSIEPIKQYLPNAKLIVMLRNPVDRAYSQFCGRRRLGLENIKEFFGAISEEPKRIREGWDPGFHYIAMGFYYQQLKKYYDAFEKDQIGIFLYDDFKNNPIKTCQSIYQFLGVDPSFYPNIEKVYNAGSLPRNELLYGLLMGAYKLSKNIIPKLANSKLRNVFKSYFEDNNIFRQAIPKLTTDERKKILDIYSDDILELQNLINRDLSLWLKP